MNDALDSRALRRTDCYGQRFMKAGKYAYNIVPAHTHGLNDDRPFIVHVKDGAKDARMKQHTVLVNAKGGKFVASTPDLTIDVGDLVLWNSLGSTPIAIAGDHEFFNSDRLFNEAGFSHAFGLPGEFRWADAFGSGLSGVVRVRDPGRCQNEESLRRWRKSLSKGTLVMIVDGKAEPAEVEIHTGQTVFFAIVKGPGVSITDERLLGIEKDSRNQCAAA